MGGPILRIGKIPYANLFPIFYVLERDMDCSQYEFVEGMPSTLNRMLRDGDIDLSPSSSVEYVRGPARYGIIDGHSISARGHVGSVLLFSRSPIEELHGGTVAVTSHSETSAALLGIILRKFYGASCALEVSDRPLDSGRPAGLLIGDEAMRYRKQRMLIGGRESGDTRGRDSNSYTHVYDLGDLWYRQTGLPFVFALWIGRKEFFAPATSTGERKRSLLEKFIGDLGHAKKTALRERPLIARFSPLRAFLSEEEILSYWDKLDYDFGPEHRRGLELFATYLTE